MRPLTIGIILLVVVLAIVGCAALFLLSGSSSTETSSDGGFFATLEGDYGGDYGGTTIEIDENAQATALASDQGAPAPTVQDSSVVNIVIALQDLPRGFELDRRQIERAIEEGDNSAPINLAPWPVNRVATPQNSFESLDELFGDFDVLIVRSDIPRESALLSTQVVPDRRQLSRVGSDAALLLEPGTVAVSMPLDLVGLGQVAFALQPGDYVDVIFSFLFIEVDEQFQSIQPNRISIITRDPETEQLSFGEPLQGRTEASALSQIGVLVVPQESQRPRLVTQRTVSRAQVIHVGYFPADGRIVGVMSPTPFVQPTADPNAQAAGEGGATPITPPTATPYTPTIVTLGVPPQDALVLVWAIDARIPITFVLRAAQDDVILATTAVTLEYIITNYSIPNPPILPFSIQPAITSIRQFDLNTFETLISDAVSSGVGDQQGQ